MRKIIDDKEMFSTDEVYKITGVKESTLRVYEAKGLLIPKRISQGKLQYKWYSEEDLFKLNIIRIYVRLHYSLDKIKELIEEKNSDYVSILDSQILALRREAAEINQLIKFAEAGKKFGVGALAGGSYKGLSVDQFFEKHPAEMAELEQDEDDTFNEMLISLKQTRSRRYKNPKIQEVIQNYMGCCDSPEDYLGEFLLLMTLVGESDYTKKCREILGGGSVELVVKAIIYRFLIDMDNRLKDIRSEFESIDNIIKRRVYLINMAKRIEKSIDKSHIFEKIELQEALQNAAERLGFPNKIELFMAIIDSTDGRLIDDDMVSFLYERLVTSFDPHLL